MAVVGLAGKEKNPREMKRNWWKVVKIESKLVEIDGKLVEIDGKMVEIG